MNALLTEFDRQFQMVRADAEGLVANLTDEQFNWRPAPGRWSIAECLDHLLITGREFLAAVDSMIQEARHKGLRGNGPFRRTWLGDMFIRNLEPPVRLRIRTLRRFVPPEAERPLQRLVADFLELQEQYRARLVLADGLDLGRVRRTNIVPLTLGQWFAMILSHQRRHLWQARQVRQAGGWR